jgi:hypothetical protein
MADFDAPARYIKRLYPPGDCLATMLRNRHTGKITHAFRTAEDICKPTYQAHLRAANANGSDVYVSANAFQPSARSRVKANVKDIRAIFLDIDENGEEIVNRIMAEMPRPWAIAASSPSKYQVLWRVQGFTPEQAEAVTPRTRSHFGADQSVWDSARVLRLPGYRNCKPYAEPYFSHEVLDNPATRIYGPGDFPRFEVDHPPVPHVQRARKATVSIKAPWIGNSLAAHAKGANHPPISRH